MKICYARKAITQLDAIFAYIQANDPRAAEKVIARISHAIDRLAQFRYSSRETNRRRARVLPIVKYPYLVFYKIDDAAQEVHILRVRHSSRIPKRHLE